MASSAQNQQHDHQLPNSYRGATSAPPPTPSALPTNLLSTSDAADALSRILHRLPPTLSIPTRRSPPTTCPPIISFPDRTSPAFLDELFSSSSQLGFFQLTDHSIPPELANSAESEALSIFNLPRDRKESYFPKNWPLGYDGDADDEGGDRIGESLCLDDSCSAESTVLSLASLREFTRAMEKVGLEVIESLSNSVGFENPLGKDPTHFCSLMWICEGVPGSKLVMPGGFYPFVVGLQYQVRIQKYSLLADSGWVSVSPQVDSVMVTIGDVLQVWSNGKLKKVRGRPVVGCLGEGKNISMTVLVTLPMDSRVYPILSKTIGGDGEIDHSDGRTDHVGGDDDDDDQVFNSFSFEDYAWRVSQECPLLKDPLQRYRIH
ncbi:hypothetical protein FNV43_RR24508 [Rhamnella rubrinervis]|uniref:Uncharacterized protein n=1 Tax=Rhamnella rubrinervis TaxID=2594499 RepID=A0A8K0GQA9_9ROSA|nr:hypothetical protein FNV43_RR24508 [Rhamnella rubrinervis]